MNHILTVILLILGVLALGGARMAESWNPSAGHVNQALTQLVAKHPTRFRYIADEIANVVPVEHESDVYWFMDNAGLLDQSKRTPRAAGAESNKIELTWRTDQYQTSEHALHDDLPWSTRDNADSQLGLELEHVAGPRDAVLLAKEIRSAADFFSTSKLSNNTGVTAAWDGTAANVRLWTDLMNAQYNVAKFGGADASDVAMGLKTWKAIAIWILSQSAATPTVGVRWQGTRALLAENPLAIPPDLSGLRLLVGSAMYSTADRPSNVSRASTGGNITDVWNGSCLVFFRGQAGMKSIALAARFMKKGWPRVRQGFYAGPRECDWYEYSENESGVKIIAASCGFLLTSANT